MQSPLCQILASPLQPPPHINFAEFGAPDSVTYVTKLNAVITHQYD